MLLHEPSIRGMCYDAICVCRISCAGEPGFKHIVLACRRMQLAGAIEGRPPQGIIISDFARGGLPNLYGLAVLQASRTSVL
jgi:hypothetical protein